MNCKSLFLLCLLLCGMSACVEFRTYEPSPELSNTTERTFEGGDAGERTQVENPPEVTPEPVREMDAGTPDEPAPVPDKSRVPEEVLPEKPTPPEKTPEKVKETKPPPTGPPALDLKKVQWLHTNVSGWKVTSQLKSVTFTKSMICLNHTHAAKWTTSTAGIGVKVAANPWVFIWNAQKQRWYAATWEWMRPGQTCKAQTSVAGDHIKLSPYDARSGWRPKKGDILYFMVSGLARNSHRNQKERSNAVKVVWP